MRLGIDFGTTRTTVAAALAGRYAVLSFNVDGEFIEYLPGTLAVRNSSIVYGWEALSSGGPALRSLKRVISSLNPDSQVPGLPGLAVTALEAAVGYLRYLRHMIVAHSNLELGANEVLEVAIAVPANADTRQRYLTLEAFGLAGFQVVGMINEPTAAAIDFAHRNVAALGPRSPKKYMVVYDLGGGTFDTSAVSLVGRRFELLATEGIGQLGGDDFDELVLTMALEQASIAPADLSGIQRTQLAEICRQAKESLRPTSRKLFVDLEAVLAGQSAVVLDTRELYERSEPLVDQTLAKVAEVFAGLAAHDLDPDNSRELGGLYVVGGSAAYPPVARALRAHYKRKLQLAPQPHAATAVGLAVFADPVAGLVVREAITRHFGVWREELSGERKVFDPILTKEMAPAGSQPIVVRRSYHPTHTVGRLRYLECGALTSDSQPAGELTPWTQVLFPYDPALADRGDLASVAIQRDDRLATEEIEETYTYDSTGTIRVAIENRTRRYRRTFVLGARGA